MQKKLVCLSVSLFVALCVGCGMGPNEWYVVGKIHQAESSWCKDETITIQPTIQGVEVTLTIPASFDYHQEEAWLVVVSRSDEYVEHVAYVNEADYYNLDVGDTITIHPVAEGEPMWQSDYEYDPTITRTMRLTQCAE